MIAQEPSSDQRKPTHEQVQELYRQGQGYRRISAQTGYSISQVRRVLGKLPEQPTRKGAPRSTDGVPSKPKSAPQFTALESRVAALESDVATVLTYIKALQSRESVTVHLSAPNGAPHPTKKRGFVIREDLSEAIDRFAETYHLEIRVVLDAALCEFFERRGFAVDAGEEVRGA